MSMLFNIIVHAQTIKNSRLYSAYRYNKSSSILPDFSYVGYHHGDDSIPTVTHNIYNVTTFGAVANDALSDRAAIEAAIAAAKANGSGIIFFPPGRFLVNETGDSDTQSITINGSNIVFRGSGSGPGGTELFMRRTMQPTDPSKMWSTKRLFEVRPSTNSLTWNTNISTINTAANIGDFNITLANKGTLQVGDWILLTMNSTDPSLLQYEVGTHPLSSDWLITTQGVQLKIYHSIKSINGNTLTLNEPISYPINPTHNWTVFKTAVIQEIGFENIAFVGNWKDTFYHHRSWVDDSGWSILLMNNTFNSWIRNCRFTDVNIAAQISSGSNISVLNCEVTGNPGHEAIFNNGATNVLFSNVHDRASQEHSVGVARTSMNTVLHNVTYPPSTCFESHSSQPRNTLLDNVEGGIHFDRAGGASKDFPHHLSNLIFWNYKQTNTPYTNLEFWKNTNWDWRIPNPIIAGFIGGSTFNSSHIRVGSESIGAFVYPKSLYEVQLNERKSLAPWLNSSNWSYTFGNQTGTFVNTVGTTGVSSLSNSTNNGFLPVPNGANTGVYIRSSGNAVFTLDGNHNLSLNTSTAGTLSRYSVNNISVASSVAKFSFNIDFSSAGQADVGNYIFAVGNNKGKLFVPSYAGSVYRASDEVFTALRFTPNTSATSSTIDFSYRLGSDATSTTTYSLINNTTFSKGGKYYIELYCNNSGSLQTYKESQTTYTLPNNSYHVWVNGLKIGGDYPRSIEVNGSTGLSSGTSIALANSETLNSFLFLSNNGSSNSTGKITLYYPAVSYLNTGSSSVALSKITSLTKADLPKTSFSVFIDSDGNICGKYISRKTGVANFFIYDAAGKKVYSSALKINQGLNEIQVRDAFITKGVYIAVLQNSGIVEQIKFIK